MKSTATLARIAALCEERRALWDRTSRLSEAERGRLLDIAAELESLWDKRRIEQASLDDRAPGVAVSPYKPDARPTRWTRRRGQTKRDPEATPREREVNM